jgi:hypothetical protein
MNVTNIDSLIKIFDKKVENSHYDSSQQLESNNNNNYSKIFHRNQMRLSEMSKQQSKYRSNSTDYASETVIHNNKRPNKLIINNQLSTTQTPTPTTTNHPNSFEDKETIDRFMHTLRDIFSIFDTESTGSIDITELEILGANNKNDILNEVILFLNNKKKSVQELLQTSNSTFKQNDQEPFNKMLSNLVTFDEFLRAAEIVIEKRQKMRKSAVLSANQFKTSSFDSQMTQQSNSNSLKNSSHTSTSIPNICNTTISAVVATEPTATLFNTIIPRKSNSKLQKVSYSKQYPSV